MLYKQQSQASHITLNKGDTVIKNVPEHTCKLEPKFSGPYLITSKLPGNKLNAFILIPTPQNLFLFTASRR